MNIDDNSAGEHCPPSSIEDALHRVLTSARFKDALQSQALLKFLVENALNGHEDALKERIIGISVFGRKPDYDTSFDPIVRSRVGQLRKRLEQYYESDEASGSTVKIVVPSGSYKPTFIFFPGQHREQHDDNAASPAEQQPAALSEANEPCTSLPPSSSEVVQTPRWRMWAIASAAVCALTLVAGMGIRQFHTSELDLFWNPIFKSKKNVVIYHGNLTAYMLSSNYWTSKLIQLQPGDREEPGSHVESPPLSDDTVLTGKDLRMVPDGFTTPGDLSAAVRVATLLNSRNRAYNLRSGDNFPFADLQGTPTVLVGAYSNAWTMTLTRNLPFFFDRGGRIRERDGQHRFWSNPAGPDNSATETVALIARLLDSETGAPVVVIAGAKTCGTAGAGEFITDPVQTKQLRTISRDALKRENLEVVLQVALDHCNPVSMKIVAVKAW